MIPHILGSKPVVEAMEADLKPRVELLRQQGIVPKLAIVRVGANPDDLSYERMAIKRAESLDIAVQVFDYPENVDPELVAGDIRYINEDASIHGCLMFRPLPEYMDEQALCNMLVPHKDVDGISVAALGGIFIDDPDALPPATAEACIKVLDHYAIPLQGKRVVVVGRSLVIGKPVSMILLRHNASVTICHSKTLDLAEVTRQADIVICATGRARAFGAEYFTARSCSTWASTSMPKATCVAMSILRRSSRSLQLSHQFLAGSDRSLPLAPWSTRFVLLSAARAKECVWS